MLQDDFCDERVSILNPVDLVGPGLDKEIKDLGMGSDGVIWIVHCRFKDGFDPFSFIRRIEKAHRSFSVVLVLDCLAELYVTMAECSGVGVVLSRDDTVETVRQGLRSAMLGAVFRSGSFERVRSGYARQHQGIVGQGLSEREIGTAVAIAMGRSISEISYDWGLSRKTVSTFRKRALSKLSLGSDAELVRFFLERYSYVLNGMGSDEKEGEDHVALPS